MTDRDDCPVHGIPRPPVGELVIRRRLRVLRDILTDPDSPYRSRLIDLTDLLLETENTDPASLEALERARGARIDLPGSPPPRRDR